MGQIARLSRSVDEVNFLNCGLACDHYEAGSCAVEEVEEGEFGDVAGGGTRSEEECAILSEFGMYEEMWKRVWWRDGLGGSMWLME
jgi:hypothetical protein